MRRHARQHDSNATIYQCKVRNCNFKSLRSDKYIEHMKKNHSDLDQQTEQTKTELVKTEHVTTTTKPSLLTTSPFNTISPPNKTVVDTFEEPNFPETQFDEAIILAATASEDDLTKLVSPLL